MTTTTVVVGGALANKAGNGGEAWVRLSWLRGLARLGLDVWFVEQLQGGSGDHPDRRPEVEWFRSVTERYAPSSQSTLLIGDEALVGPPLDTLREVASSATLVNISGHVDHRRLFPAFRRRVLVDIDPGFTQVWHGAGDPGARVSGHDVHFTIAENIGRPDCRIPTAGIEWRTVRQPVVLDDWPVTEPTERARFTTVARWRPPFGGVEIDGVAYGLKVHEFRVLLELPQRSPHTFELALTIDPADERDERALRDHGWRVVDPADVAGDPEAFRSYVARSGAELSVAQGVYAHTASGWFSDRSTRYLASGHPVLVQDTGFGRTLPTGEGLCAFRTLDDAARLTESIVRDYDRHASAARLVAERWFDSDRVLARFCDEAGIVVG